MRMLDASEYADFIEAMEKAQAEPLCMQIDPELWFPATGESNRQAVKFCNACPLRDPCLRYALKTRQEYGIWGGLTTPQRNRLLIRGRGRRADRPSRNPHPDSLVEHPAPLRSQT